MHADWRSGIRAALLCTALAGASWPRDLPDVQPGGVIREAATRRPFLPSLVLPGRTTSLELVGVGHRDKWGVTYYAVGLYVEREGLRRAMGAQRGVDEAIQALMGRRIPVCIQVQYVQNVSGVRRTEIIREQFALRWKGTGSYEALPGMTEFLAFFRKDIRRGDQTYLWFLPGGRILFQDGQEEHIALVPSPQLQDLIFDIYFGPESISRELRQGLFSRLGTLLGAE